MNLKSCHSVKFATVLLALMLPVAAFAQEEKSVLDNEKAVIQQDHESPNGSDPEVRASKNQGSGQQDPVVIRDSEIKNQKTPAQTAPKAIEKPQKDEEKAEKVQKKEEDPLSFNFLYYIIEKFKFSDIVE